MCTRWSAPDRQSSARVAGACRGSRGEGGIWNTDYWLVSRKKDRKEKRGASVFRGRARSPLCLRLTFLPNETELLDATTDSTFDLLPSHILLRLEFRRPVFKSHFSPNRIIRVPFSVCGQDVCFRAGKLKQTQLRGCAVASCF